MQDREMKTAKRFGVYDRIAEFEGKLLEIDHVVDVEFDLSGFYDDIRQVIFLPKYDIPASLPDYFEVRKAMLQQVLDVAAAFGLKSSGDTIEDYGEHFYIVRSCDDSWVLQRDASYADPEVVTAINEVTHEVVGTYDWTMPRYNADEYDSYDDYESDCLDVGHERRAEICGKVIEQLKDCSAIKPGDETYYEVIDETVWDEITNCICKKQDDKTVESTTPKTRYFMMDVYNTDRLIIEGRNVSPEQAMESFRNLFGYAPDIVKTIDELGGTLDVLKDVSDGIDKLIDSAVSRSKETDNGHSEKAIDFVKE